MRNAMPNRSVGRFLVPDPIPPRIIEDGTREVLLDIAPRVPPVFQTFYPVLDEAAAALDRAGRFLSAHLAGAERAVS
jgi:hypothetical protein